MKPLSPDSFTRPATLRDLGEVAAWITSARDCELWAGWRVQYPINLASLPSEISFAATNAFSLFDGSALVAFGQLFVRGSCGHLGRIIVAPSARGQGFGEALVRELVKTARLAGCERVSLCVDPANAPALGLYTKLGFHDARMPEGECSASGSKYLEAALSNGPNK